MSVKRYRVASLVAAAVISALSARAGAAEEQVLRFKSAAKVRTGGEDHLVIVADAPRGGHSARFVAPNKTSGHYDPPAEQADAIKALHPGDLIQVTSEAAAGGVSMLQSIASYAPKPGEAAPGGFVFVSSNHDDPAHPTFVASKLGERTTFSLQLVKDDKGEQRIDPAVWAEVEKFKEGDSIWVDAPTPTTAAAVLPWNDPRNGKLVKVEPVSVEGQRGGFAVHLDAGGTALVATVPGHVQGDKWVSDPRLTAAAHRFRPGTEILFRVQETGASIWLRDLQPVPQPVAQRTNGRPQNGGGNNSNTDANGLPRGRIPGGGTPGVGGIGF